MSSIPKSTSAGTTTSFKPGSTSGGSPSISISSSSLGAAAAAAAAYSSNMTLSTSVSGQGAKTAQSGQTPSFLERDSESSASAKRRSLVRAGGTASSPDLRTLVHKKAQGLAQANAGNAASNGATTSSTGTGQGKSGIGANEPVPFPSARSGSLGAATTNSGSRRPSKDDEYASANSTLPSSNSGATAAAVPGSVSIAEEVALSSPSLATDEKGTVKGGAFKERMKKTSGFLRRLRGGGAAANAEPMPAQSANVGLGVNAPVSSSVSAHGHGKPVPPLPPAHTSQYTGGVPLKPTRSASHVTYQAGEAPGRVSEQFSSALHPPASSSTGQGTPSNGPSGSTTPAGPPQGQSGATRAERDLPVPPRPIRRVSRGTVSSGTTSPPAASPSTSPMHKPLVLPSIANVSSGRATVPPPPSFVPPSTHSHRATHSIDPEIDPDVATFADRAWTNDEPLNLRPPALSLVTNSLGSQGGETVKASSLGAYAAASSPGGASSTTPSGTPISSRFASQASGAVANGSTSSGNTVSIVLQRSDRERKSFSSTIASGVDATGGMNGSTPTSGAPVTPLPATRKMSDGDQSLRSHGGGAADGDATSHAEKAWNEEGPFARKEKIAEWLGSDIPLNRAACTAYFKHFDFASLRVDVAFRKLCDKLFLRAETQQVDRILYAFSQRYWECNPTSIYGSADVVHSIVFSLLLLNTDLHVADIQDRMTRQQFVRNTMAAIQESAGDGASSAGGGGASSAGGSIYGAAGATVSASNVNYHSPRLAQGALGGESTTSLSRLSTDIRNESSEFVGTVNAATLAPGSALGGTLGASSTLAPARPSRRGSIRSYQGFFRSGNSSAVNVGSPRMGADGDDNASIASGDRPSGFASPPSTSRGQYPPPVGLNAPLRQRARSGSGTASLSDVQNAINSRTWMNDLEAQLKDIYNTVKNDQIRLPMYDSRATLSPSFARRGMRNLTVGGTGTGRVNALKRGSIRGIQGLLGSSTTISSEGTTSPASSLASRSFLDGSPHTPATSLSGSTGSQPAMALGFASTLSQSIIKEAQDEEASPSAHSVSDEIDDDDLALMGPPWAKEGFLTRKHYYEGPHKRSKEKAWVEVFVVVQKGMLNMFQFNSNPSATIKAKGSAGPVAVVGGGNWLANATPLGEFPLAHTLANALPPPGYNRARPHVFALTLPGGIVYLFQAGHEELVQEWVATCNYWAARQSREPLAGGVSNMEYGWNKVLPREYDEVMDDDASMVHSLSNGNGGPASSYDPSALYAPGANRPADSRSVRSGRSTRSFRERAGAALYQNWHDAAALVAPSSKTDSVKDGLGGGAGGVGGPGSQLNPSILSSGQSPVHANERIFINEWKAPEAPMVASGLSEEKQLERCAKHMATIETDLTAHNELRQPMLQLYSPRGTNYAKALANWERKSNHLLQELVKYQCYVESLKNAMRLRAEKHDLKEVDKMLATADEELSRLR